MFVNAIEEVAAYTRPIHTISRNYKETFVIPGAATIFFVNKEGCAITCKHVADLLGSRESINDHYKKFKSEKTTIGINNKYKQRIKSLEDAYNIKEGTMIQLKELFGGVTSDPELSYHRINHPKYDLTILIFENFRNPLYQNYARFLKDSSILKQGLYLCRLGFAFPEFTNFRYNDVTDDIEWTNSGQTETPRFPIEGMLTRHLMNEGEIMGIEMSTPGLRGQSGGPLFNQEGLVCGMQYSTGHLHLGFDMKNFEINSNGRFLKVTNQPFLHVGHNIHVDIIKSFLKTNNIRFYEE
jgi:hypothetical protein